METCEYSHCKNEPMYICPCPSKDSAFCADHVKDHVREQGYHGRVSENFIGISEGEKVNIALQCEAALIELKKIKEKISLEANKAMKIIIEATVSNYEYIKHEEDIFKEILEFLSINNKIIKRKEYSAKDQKIIDSMENPQRILEELKLKEKEMIAKVNYKTDQDIIIIANDCSDKIEEMKQDIVEKSSDLTDKLENLKKSAVTCIEHYINQSAVLLDWLNIKVPQEYYNEKFIQENMSEFKISEKLNNYKILNFPNHFYDDTYKSRYLGFFDDNTKVFNVVDCLEVRMNKIDTNIETPLWMWAGWCEIPDNKMIYYSGHNSVNKTCPIAIYEFNFETPQNPITYEIDKNKVKGKGFTGALGFYNNCIYCFGGYISGYIKDSGRFDLQTKEWEDLESLPEVCGYNSCVVSMDKLAVTGYNPAKIFVYDPVKKNYEHQGNFPTSHKFIAKGNSMIFMFENGKIHETKEGEYNFVQVNGSSGVVAGYALISFVVCHKIYLYFVLHNRRLYKFNLITKTVQDLRAL